MRTVPDAPSREIPRQSAPTSPEVDVLDLLVRRLPSGCRLLTVQRYIGRNDLHTHDILGGLVDEGYVTESRGIYRATGLATAWAGGEHV